MLTMHLTESEGESQGEGTFPVPSHAIVIEREPGTRVRTEVSWGSGPVVKRGDGDLRLDGLPWPEGTCNSRGRVRFQVELHAASPNCAGVCRVHGVDVPVTAGAQVQ